MPPVRMVLVGGFLGAGKTTLLARAAERLGARGLRVGLITNDQAANLVDTEVLRQSGGDVKEVSGACFCCAFNKLLYVCENLRRDSNPDVIIAEPVGSCTDLSATVLAPLKKLCADRFLLSPYSVLVDPDRLGESPAADPPSDLEGPVLYVYRKQLEEADLIVVNKTDALAPGRLEAIKAALEREFPARPVLAMSALSGDGVDAWLDLVLSGQPAGRRIVEVDYDIYAEGEAALGWLNAAVHLAAAEPTDWQTLALDVVSRIQDGARRAGAEIAHLKLLLSAGGGSIQVNLTRTAGRPALKLAAPKPSAQATLVLNARVQIDPDQLRRLVQECLRAAAGEAIQVNFAEMTSFRPARPQPVHRLTPAAD